MPLKHGDIWQAIDQLAERHKLSASGLARKAGLSPTIFNPSKRLAGGRKHWPSTESISRILQATGTELQDFVALAQQGRAARATLPLLGYAEAGREGYFDEAGYPVGNGWEEVAFPALEDPHAFMLEISGSSMESVYRPGDRIIVSPAEKPRKGDRVVARLRKGEVLAKQLGRETVRTIELVSLNPAFPPLQIDRADVAWLYRILWVSQS